jgi:hypothetical protein
MRQKGLNRTLNGKATVLLQAVAFSFLLNLSPFRTSANPFIF